MGKFTISMAIFNSYVSLPEGFPPFSRIRPISRRGTATFDGAAIASAVLKELKTVGCPVPGRSGLGTRWNH
jgi:hypothetical protein